MPGSTGDQLLRNADLAMYMAKEQGKDCYEEFRDQMHTAIVERLELEADLRRTMTGKELVVHYQPIFDLDDRRASSASKRSCGGNTRLRGLLPPGSFVPFAEEVGLIDWSTVSSSPKRVPSFGTGRRGDSFRPDVADQRQSLGPRAGRRRNRDETWPRAGRQQVRPVQPRARDHRECA